MNVLGFAFLAGLAIFVVGVFIRMAAQFMRTSPVRVLWFYRSAQLMAVGALSTTLCIFARNHWSPRVTAIGAIDHLQKIAGKQESTSVFNLDEPNGQQPKLNARYTGPNLRNGETVRVLILKTRHSILDLQVLDGPYAGWRLQEPGGTPNAALLMLFDLALIGHAIFRYWRLSKLSAPA